MKRFRFIAIITAVLFTIISVCSLTSCNTTDANTSDSTTATPTEESTTAPTEPEYDFPELAEEDEEILTQYITDVQKRISGVGFITEDETKYFMTNDELHIHSDYVQEYKTTYGYTTDYYYPVMYSDNKPILVFTDEYGNVLSKYLDEGGSTRYYGRLHRSETLNEKCELMSADINREIIYQNSEVQVYQFKELIATYDIPEGSNYCGKSAFEGYIFHKGNEAFALRSEFFVQEEASDEFELVKIADNVKYVILADYELGSDPWSQPLFLMNDGSLKAYVSWEGDKDDPADSGHLVDLHQEGGYRRLIGGM